MEKNQLFLVCIYVKCQQWILILKALGIFYNSLEYLLVKLLNKAALLN